MHFVIDFIVGHLATTFPLGEHTQLNGVTEVWTSISADGAGTGAEKILKKAMFNNSVVFGWEILKDRNILHMAWHVLTPELCMVVVQLSFTLL